MRLFELPQWNSTLGFKPTIDTNRVFMALSQYKISECSLQCQFGSEPVDWCVTCFV